MAAATTNNALVLREESTSVAARSSNQITDVQRLGGLLAASGYFSDAREMAQAAVKVMAGEELGIPPVAAMMGMYIVKGKIVLSGNLIASRIRAHGYNYIHKQFDAKGCVLQFVGKKGEMLGESSFTEADAKAAKCFSDMYEKYPRNMYFNRAISNGAKWYTPEVFAGAPVYVAEELGQRIDEQGDMIHEEPTPQQQTQARKDVMDRKLSEIRSAKPEPAPAEILPEPAPQPSTLDQILASFTKVATVDAAFAQMKEHFCQILDESIYLQIMAENGLGEGEQRTAGKAKKAFAALWNTYQAELARIDAEEAAQ